MTVSKPQSWQVSTGAGFEPRAVTLGNTIRQHLARHRSQVTAHLLAPFPDSLPLSHSVFVLRPGRALF